MVAGCFALVIDEQLILSLVAAMGKSIVLATTETEIPPTDAQIPGRGCVFVHHSFASCMGGKPSVLLNTLPKEVRGKLAPLFMANAIGQTGLNGQLNGTAETLFPIVKSALTKAGYSEQPIRTTIGPWGFSATWAPPTGVSVDGTASQKTAVLVTQATALGPERVNLNVRFDGL